MPNDTNPAPSIPDDVVQRMLTTLQEFAPNVMIVVSGATPTTPGSVNEVYYIRAAGDLLNLRMFLSDWLQAQQHRGVSEIIRTFNPPPQ